MQILAELKALSAHVSPALVQVIISLVIILFYVVMNRRIAPFLYKTIAASVLKEEMNRRAVVVFHILLFLLLVVVLSIVWGIDIKGLLVLASSMIAVIGVALFAAWSLISNITAFFIMLGQRNFSPGAQVRIIDGANHVEGKVLEINLFSTVLLTKQNEQVVYPNNLIVSRPVICAESQCVAVKTKPNGRWRRKHTG